MHEVVRAIMHKAAYDGGWLYKVPQVRMPLKPKRRIRRLKNMAIVGL